MIKSRVYWANVFAGWLLLAFSVWFYLVANQAFNQRFDGYFVLVFAGKKYGDISFSTHRLIAYLGYFYAAFFPFYYAAIHDGKFAKSANFFIAVWRSFKRLPWLEEHRQAVAAFALKFLFAVFMLDVWVKDCMSLVAGIDSVYRYFTDPWYDRVVWASDPFGVFFHAFMSIVYYVDLMPFLIGYFVNLPNRHQIKSVETTFSGWFWCMLCYYPFSFGTGALLPTRYEDYLPMIGYLGPDLGSYVAWGFNIVAGLLMALYASASVSLGFKASNLTSRGVVRSGMYSVIRHPAYAFKNAAWWVWSLGFAYFQYLGKQPFIVPLLGLAGWTFIYYKRAVTEEQHLLRSDPEYADYMKQVPYRFIPRVL